MKKYIISIFFLFTLTIACFGFNYWWLDVYVDDFKENLSSKPSSQRLYLFKDLNSFQEATSQRAFDWITQTRNLYGYEQTIYNTMRKEGLTYAFVLVDRGYPRNRNDPHYWIYRAYTLQNGIGYVSIITREHQPISF